MDLPFQIVGGPLGAGATGTVWRALAPRADVEVAVKFLPGAGGDPAWLAEAELIGRLDHPSVLRLLDYGQLADPLTPPGGATLPAGTGWLATEFLPGGTLQTRVEDGALDWWGVRDVLIELAQALAHAHARDVLHRDLKPSNVLLGPDGGRGAGVRLADFGGALARDRGGARDSQRGTPGYRPREIAFPGSGPQGPWSDLYGLGALAWALLTGEPPGGAGVDLWRLDGAPPVFRPRVEVPAGLEGLLGALLASEPAERPEFAYDVVRALRELDAPDTPAHPRVDTAVGAALTITPSRLDTATTPPEEEPPLPAPLLTDRSLRRWVPPGAAEPGAPYPEPFEPMAHRGGPTVPSSVVAVRSLRLRPLPASAWGSAGGALLRALFEVCQGAALQRRLVDTDPAVLRRVLGWFEGHCREFGVRTVRLDVGADGQRPGLLGALPPGWVPAGGGDGGPALDPDAIALTLQRRCDWRPLVVLVPEVDRCPGPAELLARLWPRGSTPGVRLLVVETSGPASEAPVARSALEHAEVPVRSRREVDFPHTLRACLSMQPALLRELQHAAHSDLDRALPILEHWLAAGWVSAGRAGLAPGSGAPPSLPPELQLSPEEAVARWYRGALRLDRAALDVAMVLQSPLREVEWAAVLATLLPEAGEDGCRAAVAAARSLLVELHLCSAGPEGWILAAGAFGGLAEAGAAAVPAPLVHAAVVAWLEGVEGVPAWRRSHHLLGAGRPHEAARHAIAAARARARSGELEAALGALDAWALAADRAGLSAADPVRAEVVVARAELLVLGERWKEAEALLDPVVESFGVRADHPLLLARALRFRGMARRGQQDRLGEAAEDLERALQEAEAAGAEEELARAWLHRGNIARRGRFRAQAERALGEARARFAALHDDHGSADTLLELANCAAELGGDWAAAERLAEEARSLFVAVGWRRGELNAELTRAGALMEGGQNHDAAALYQHILGEYERAGWRGARACRVNLGVLALREGRVAEAHEQFQAVLRSAEKAGSRWLVPEAHLGRAACAEDPRAWRDDCAEALAGFRGARLDGTREELRQAARTRGLTRGFGQGDDRVAAFLGLGV